jgi:hypothetical protein
MDGHERDAVLALLVAVEVGDQRDLIEVELELGPLLAFELVLVRDVEVPGAREELAQVVEARFGLGRVFLLERALVSRLRQDLADQVLEGVARAEVDQARPSRSVKRRLGKALTWPSMMALATSSTGLRER